VAALQYGVVFEAGLAFIVLLIGVNLRDDRWHFLPVYSMYMLTPAADIAVCFVYF